ncbi:MAG: hypothetical protein HC902_01665 [Calothrix sp. SM1_5_4]|nr:hypothetical protein [Calothrix sp. SM1_5_4]
MIKILYRKLVRKLHPDANANENEKTRTWKDKLWLQVQSSYRAGNVSALQKHYSLALLRDRDLNSLTISEINASQDWLNEGSLRPRTRGQNNFAACRVEVL